MRREGLVRAAGGVVWRRTDDGAIEVLLVHRPRHDDWSFPKGKNHPAEDDLACARREVAEETGIEAIAGIELPSVRYLDQRGRPKVVRYWAMTVGADGGFEPSEEVDERSWLGLDEAARRLTYEPDRGVLEAFAAGSATTG